MFKFDIDSSKKLFYVIAEGMFTIDEAQFYLDEYDSKIKSVNPNEYIFLIDARKQSTSIPEVGELLSSALRKYMDTPFKKRYVVKLDSVIAMAQIKRLAGKEFNEKFIIVNTPEEVINNL